MFRSSFQYGGRINWFPGHMIQSRKKLQETLRMIDVVLEIRDARAPLSTEFPFLDDLVPPGSSRKKSRVIVLNKIDLCNQNLISRFKEILSKDTMVQTTQAMYLDQKQHPRHPLQLVKSAANFHHSRFPPPANFMAKPFIKEINMLVVGLPNVGKSSLINSIRSASGLKKSAKMGAMPGVTRNISGFQACTDPPTFLVDTPGIMVPGNMEDTERALTLALLGTINEKIVPLKVVADFLLYKLCQLIPQKAFLAKLGLPADFLSTHGDEIDPFLLELCKIYNFILPNSQPDILKAARTFIDKFRSGELGPITLDYLSGESNGGIVDHKNNEINKTRES